MEQGNPGRGMRAFPAAVLLAGAALVLAAPAAAQSVAATVNGVIDGTLINPADCAQTFAIGVTVSCTRTGPGGASFAGRARVDDRGRLRGTSAAQHDGAGTVTLGTAGASWTDTARFGPFATPVIGRIFIAMDGFQFATTDGDGSSLAAATGSIMRLGVYRDGNQIDPAAFDEIQLDRSLLDYGTYQSHTLATRQVVRGVSGPFLVDPVPADRTRFNLFLAFEIEPGISSIQFFWNFATNSYINPGFTGSAQTFYFSTAAITGFQFLDLDGADITSRAGLSFDSGQDYPIGAPPAGAIPEPATWALMVAGFGLLGGALRRRRLPARAEG